MARRKLSSFIIALGMAGAVHAGPLTPPAGPVAPSGKTLMEIEPRVAINAQNTPGDADSVFRIAQPGSYYLTANVTGVTGKKGIEVVSDGVSVDLNGFEMVGVAGATVGIGPSGGTFQGLIIRNGTVRGWPSGGIIFPLGQSLSRADVFEKLILRSNGGTGLECRNASVVRDCVAIQNTIGFEIGESAVFANCAAVLNGSDGFRVSFGTSVTACTARANGGNGFGTGGGDCTLTACASTLNSGSGFSFTRASMSACSSGDNDGWGVELDLDSHITGCSIGNNDGGGILLGFDCSARDNTISGGPVGIRTTGSDNRLEGNNVSDCTTGIDVPTTGNLIIRNSASGGVVRFNIVAGNAAGPIVNAAGAATTTVHTANFDF